MQFCKWVFQNLCCLITSENTGIFSLFDSCLKIPECFLHRSLFKVGSTNLSKSKSSL